MPLPNGEKMTQRQSASNILHHQVSEVHDLLSREEACPDPAQLAKTIRKTPEKLATTPSQELPQEKEGQVCISDRDWYLMRAH